MQKLDWTDFPPHSDETRGQETQLKSEQILHTSITIALYKSFLPRSVMPQTYTSYKNLLLVISPNYNTYMLKLLFFIKGPIQCK